MNCAEWEGWLRGLDLNQRPLGYEPAEGRLSNSFYGTSGNPKTFQEALVNLIGGRKGVCFGDGSRHAFRSAAGYVSSGEYGSNGPNSAIPVRFEMLRIRLLEKRIRPDSCSLRLRRFWPILKQSVTSFSRRAALGPGVVPGGVSAATSKYH